MKYLCACGEVVVDQTDYLSHKAYFISDESIEKFEDHIDEILDQLRLMQNDSKYVVTQIKNLRQTIGEMRSGYFRKIYQCNNCGRINIDAISGNLGYSFVPEDEDSPKNLLSAARAETNNGV